MSGRAGVDEREVRENAPLLSSPNISQPMTASNRRSATRRRRTALRFRIGQHIFDLATASWCYIGFAICLAVAQTPAVAVVLYMSQELTCEVPLAPWLVVLPLVQWLKVSLIVGKLRNGRTPCIDSYERFINWVELLWFILGWVWFSSAEPCATTASPVYQLTRVLLIINSLTLFFPCFLCLISVCCLPCVFLLLGVLLQLDVVNSGAPQHVISRFRTIKYRAGLLVGEPLCCICTDEFEEDDVVTILPCDERHFFHKACVDQWMIARGSCPLCRHDYTEQQEEEDDDTLIHI
eukprot:GILI01017739.1.p1 GENE.GILI01017739.1~~GILI01017739.1.p1  ORF type:complete len:293 (+),score=72.84 GILI01017739.1:71-949(+)